MLPISLSLLLHLPLVAAPAEDQPAQANHPDGDLVTVPRAELEEIRAAIAELEASRDAGLELPFTVDLSATLIHQTLSGTDHDDGDHMTGSMDLVLEAPLWDGAVGVIDFEAIGGDGPDAVLPTFGGWNADGGTLQSEDGVDRVSVLEALISTPVGGHEDLFLTFGKVDLTGFFDPNDLANDETAQFLYGAFVNSAAFEAPDPSAGAVLSYQPAAGYDLHLAVSSPDNSGTEPTSHVFTCAQLGCYPQLFGRDGSYALYGWSDGSRDDLSGLGLSGSQSIADGLDLFGRVAWQGKEESATDAMSRAWSCGVQCSGLWQDEDGLGLAFGETTSREAGLVTESAWEIYYRRPMNEHLDASLHVMGVDAPGGDDAGPDAVALVLRLQIGI